MLTTKIIAFLRGDRRFDSLDALKAQTAKDVARAKEILAGGLSSPPLSLASA